MNDVESAISSIGEVSINNNESIGNAESLYEVLSDKKEDVRNHDMLGSTQETYIGISK